MSLGLDPAVVRETYQRLTDAELTRVATQDAAGLTPEAQEIVQEEIKRRGLDISIVRGVQAQNRKYTIAEIDAYCELVRALDCPLCASYVKLNATMTNQVVSVIVMTHYKKKVVVACPDCLDKANTNALTTSVLAGWWGIPWGIIRTIQAINGNIASKKTNHSEEPNKYLRGFVLGKIGEMEAYKDNKEKLRELIRVK